MKLNPKPLMTAIIALLQCVDKTLNKTSLGQLAIIVTAILSMTGRVTMLGISRWAGAGGSYRSVQRFFNTSMVWRKLNWLLIGQWLIQEDETLLIAGEETVVTKAGKASYGLDRFFSSLFGKLVPGLAFFALSLIRVKRHRSAVGLMEQLTKEQTTTPKAATKSAAQDKPQSKWKRVAPKVARTRTSAMLPCQFICNSSKSY